MCVCVCVCVFLKNMAARQHGSGDREFRNAVLHFQHLPQHFLTARTHTHKRVMVDSVMCHVRLVECTIQ